MKKISFKLKLGITLLLLSIAAYGLHFILFRDAHHIFLYLIGDIGFLFIEVLIVTLILHKILDEWEKNKMLEKMNMIIGLFFSEFGSKLLAYFSNLDADILGLKTELVINNSWNSTDFSNASKKIKSHKAGIEARKINVESLSSFLFSKRDLLMKLMGNPNLVEHERFTDLLRAIFHLSEELMYRMEFSNLPESDLEHLAGDIRRAYSLLLMEWLSYMKHLKNNFPYYFSLAMRTNPFDSQSSVIVLK